jgi:hypothetical protein
LNKILGTIEFAVLLIGLFFGYKWATHPDGNYEPWLYLGGLAFVAIEIIRRYRSELLGKEGRLTLIIPWIKHWLNRPVILPHQRSNWWHMGRTGDQKNAMQIVSYWYVTNTTDRPVNILNAYIKRPFTLGHVLTKDVHSDYHGSYPIPPHATVDLHADFWITPPLCKEGKNLKLDIVFVDQYGQKRTVKNTTFPSDEHKGPIPAKLETEAVYKLEHDIEKKVASVLKDEISRYKKYGRSSGELGSVYAAHQERKIKSIYQDGWTSDKSGERQEIVNDPENSDIYSDNGDSLVEFFKAIKGETDKEFFLNSLLSRISREKEYYCVSYLIIYVLYRIGRLTDGLDAVKNRLSPKPTWLDILFRRKPTEKLLENHQRHGYSDALGMINGLLRYEHQSFTENDLDIVEEFVTNIDEYSFQIEEKINSVRSYRLSHNNSLQPTDKNGG